MIKSNKNESLAYQIANILTPAPILDPEDEVDETKARLSPVESLENDPLEEEVLSKFRKRNIDLLADVDQRYSGRKGSRKDLQNENEEIETQVFEESESDDQSDESAEEEEEENEDYQESGESDLEFNNKEDAPDNYKHMKEIDVPIQVRKGICVKNQLTMWETLLEMRIQLQKCLVAANKLPQPEVFSEIKSTSGSEFTSKVNETKDNVSRVLEKLLLLQNLVLKKYPETKKLNKKEMKIEDEDEEIPSDTEEEIHSGDEDITEPCEKKKRLNDFENLINTHYKSYKDYRNSVIQKWYDKTRIAILRNSSTQHSVIKHIEHILNDKSKLIKRTQLKRSDYRIVGQENEQLENDTDSKPSIEEYSPEIFDDDDFYHQLLRELIEMKSADVTDPIQLGRQWIQLQNLRSKMKKKVDMKATKGRKIRYAVHSKLVNFMAPVDESTWTDEAKTELYGSLFGKKQPIVTQ